MSFSTRADEVQGAQSFCAAFQQTVREQPNAPALRSSDGAVQLTWREYGDRVRRIAAGLSALGVHRGDTVALMLTNRPEFHLVDAAAMHLGATPFSIYNTSSPEQMDYLFGAAGNRVVVCEEQFLDRVRTVGAQRGLEHIVCVAGGTAGAIGLDDLEACGASYFDFEAAWRAVRREDVMTLIFTSGTTGPAKAVELTHANMLWSVTTWFRTPELIGGRLRGGVALSFLPDAHLANRKAAHYLPMVLGATTVTVRDPKTVLTVIQQAHPSIFLAVPMVWYKLKAAAEQLIGAESDERRALLTEAVVCGIEKVRLERAGSPVPDDLRNRVADADRALFAPLRAELGVDNLRGAITGGAPIAVEALEFVMALGIPIVEAWAMSETSGSGTLNPPQRIKPGTVGRPVPGIEATIADDGELLVRGPGVMKGYRNDPEKTAEAVDSGGWLHTGDIARIDSDGYVTIVDRKKEIIINAAGKNMSPANIENAVKTACPLIGTVMAIGDRRPYVVALLTLDPEAAAAFAAAQGITEASARSLADDPLVHTEVQAGIDRANATLSRVEQIKAFHILGRYWLPDSDEMTPTMKLRRRAVSEKYAAEIEQIYTRPRPRAAAATV